MEERLAIALKKYGYTKDMFAKDCSVLNNMIDIEEDYLKGTFSFSRDGQNKEVNPCLLYCLGSIMEENILDAKTVIFRDGLSESKINKVLEESCRAMYSLAYGGK